MRSDGGGRPVATATPPRRRTRWAAAGAGAVLLSVMPLGGGPAADAATEPGEGLAFAQAMKIDPKAGGLSVGIAFGQATANHQNDVAKAVSTGTHLGVVGSTLAARTCDDGDPTWRREDQPQPLVVDSRDPGAATGINQVDYGMFQKFGQAKGTPFAKANTRTGAWPYPNAANDAGEFEMGTMTSTASSGIVNGEREARATVEIAYVAFPNNVRLAKLRWDALYRSTGDKRVEGRFTIGSAVVNGTQRNTENPTQVLQSANATLQPLGFRLVPGGVRTVGSMVVVDPLSIVVIPQPTRDGTAGQAFGAAHPVRRDVFKQILDRYCRAGTYISVVDIVVGSLTGAGDFVLSLGGVQASSGLLPTNSFNLDPGTSGEIPGIDAPPLESPFTSGGTNDVVTYTPGAPGPPGSTPPPQMALTQLASGTGDPPPPPFRGTRGGALAVVGIVALCSVALAAEADRRMTRRALAQAAAAG